MNSGRLGDVGIAICGNFQKREEWSSDHFEDTKPVTFHSFSIISVRALEGRIKIFSVRAGQQIHTLEFLLYSVLSTDSVLQQWLLTNLENLHWRAAKTSIVSVIWHFLVDLQGIIYGNLQRCHTRAMSLLQSSSGLNEQMRFRLSLLQETALHQINWSSFCQAKSALESPKILGSPCTSQAAKRNCIWPQDFSL